MKLCPTCQATYPDDANFCPRESCATPSGPQRLAAAGKSGGAASAAPPPSNDRFTLGARIGGGNTGEIYRATDTQTGTEVAYKVVFAEVLPNAAAMARAEREFKQLGRVKSAGIASIIDTGRTPDERVYVAMELCQGETLEQVLRAGAMDLERAKGIVAQIGQALLEAQKAGIVHRDVSPKNVLVTPSGDVKIVNFPIAKPLNDKVAGVAAYVAPEQVQGRPVDQRSNTYSLAAIFYHLLTGEPPFQGTPETVLELHVSSPPLAPSQRRPEAGLSPEVDRVILKALDKNSSRRHLTLRLFLSEVASLVSTKAGATGSGAGADKGAKAGFARTMLFAGGQAEVANLVAKAIAQRGSPAHGVPITPSHPGAENGVSGEISRRAPIPLTTPRPATPARGIPAAEGRPVSVEVKPQARRVPAATPASSAAVESSQPAAQVAAAAADGQVKKAVAKTASGEIGAHVRLSTPADAPTPAPAVSVELAADPPSPKAPREAVPVEIPAKPSPPAAAAKAPESPEPEDKDAAAKGSGFRETLWFKKGDVEHMIAEARAKMSAKSGRVSEAEIPAEDSGAIEEKYLDDGSLTPEDRQKFSLRTGKAAAGSAARSSRVPGEAMSEKDVIREVSGGGRGVMLAVAAIVVAAVIALVVSMMRGKEPSVPPAPTPAAQAIPAPAPIIPTPPPAAGPAKARAQGGKPAGQAAMAAGLQKKAPRRP